MFTLRQLSYLVALSDTLSFRRAAERCHVAQPTLSVQIRELEAHLGVQLFERTRRKVTLTPLGREIAERARAVLRSSQDIVDLARSASRPLAGPLRLGVIATLGPYLLPYVLSAFREAHPDLRLYIREDPAQRLISRLQDGDLDLVLVDLPASGEGVEGLALFREPLWLAVPDGHALATRPQITAQDMAGQDILMLEEGHCLRGAVLQLCQKMGAMEHTGFEATSLDTLRQMVASRIGPAILPALYVAAEAAHDDQIHTIPFADPQPERQVALLWRTHSARKEEFREFAAFVTARLPDHVRAETPPFPV